MKQLSPAEVQRILLLPIWIRVYCWFFIAVAILGFLTSLPLSFTDLSAMLYFGYYLIVIFLWALLAFIIITSFGLLRGKRWGIYLGIIQGLIGLLLAAVGIFNGDNTRIIVSIIIALIFIPWTLAMLKVKNSWLFDQASIAKVPDSVEPDFPS